MTSTVGKSRPDSAAENHRYGFVYNPSGNVETVEDPAAGASSLISDADLADFDFVGNNNNNKQQHHQSRPHQHQSPDMMYNPLYTDNYSPPPGYGHRPAYTNSPNPNNNNNNNHATYSSFPRSFPDWTGSHSFPRTNNNIKPSKQQDEQSQMRAGYVNTAQNSNSKQQPRPDEYGFYSASLPSLSTSDSSGGPSSAPYIGGETGSLPSSTTSKPVRTKQPMEFDDQQQVLERRRRRRESHNAVERRRRDNINGKIQELSSLLPESFFYDTHSTAYIAHSRPQQQMSPESESPPTVVFGYDMEPSHTTISGLTKDGKPNKGAILQKSVEYIRHLEDCLRQERERSNALEDELNRRRYASQQPPQDWPHIKPEPQDGSDPADHNNDTRYGNDAHHQLSPHEHNGMSTEFQQHSQPHDPNRMDLSSFEDYSSSTGPM